MVAPGQSTVFEAEISWVAGVTTLIRTRQLVSPGSGQALSEKVKKKSYVPSAEELLELAHVGVQLN
jgi:hypothetical protein